MGSSFSTRSVLVPDPVAGFAASRPLNRVGDTTRVTALAYPESKPLGKTCARMFLGPACPREMKCLFLDEAGNFDFTENGTPYLMVCATLLEIDPRRSGELSSLRYELNAAGHDIESFHASANTPYIRQTFLRRLYECRANPQVFAIVLDKRMFPAAPSAPPQVYVDLFKLALAMAYPSSGDCPIYADRIPLERARKSIMKAVRQTLGQRNVHFHASASSLELQVADYCTWAVWRQIVRQDTKPWELLGSPTIHLAVLGQGRPPQLS